MAAQDDAVSAHAAAVLAADIALFQAGVASVPPVIATPDVQTQIDAAVAAFQATVQPQIDSLKSTVADDESKLASVTALEQSMADKLEKVRQLIAS